MSKVEEEILETIMEEKMITDKEVVEETKNFIIRVLKGGNDAHPQEIAILQQMLDRFSKMAVCETYPDEYLA